MLDQNWMHYGMFCSQRCAPQQGVTLVLRDREGGALLIPLTKRRDHTCTCVAVMKEAQKKSVCYYLRIHRCGYSTCTSDVH